MESYIDLGEKKQEVLVFIHGLGSKKESWTYQFELSKKFRLIVPDLRGHGDSELETDISLQSFATDILSLLDALGIQQAHFCGLSLGGLVAQEILRMQPERVKTLILSNTASYIPPILGMMAVEERRIKLKTSTDIEYKQHILNLCLDQPVHPKEQQRLASLMFNINRRTYLPAARSAIGANYTLELMTSTKPILIIGSLFDRVTYYINALTMNTFASSAQLKTFTNASHIPHVEEPDTFNHIVTDFILGQSLEKQKSEAI